MKEGSTRSSSQKSHWAPPCTSHHPEISAERGKTPQTGASADLWITSAGVKQEAGASCDRCAVNTDITEEAFIVKEKLIQ